MLSISLMIAAFDVLIILIKNPTIDYFGYLKIIMVSLFVMSIGYFYRLSQRDERIANASICTSLLIFFTMCLGLFNYLMLPLTRSTIDIPIAEIDAMLGFHWPDVMAFAAQFPITVFVMKIAYSSTIFQLAVLIIILGLSGRNHDLNVLIMSLTITGTLTVCFWGLFPTIGAKTMYDIPDEIWQAINPPVNKLYALELIELAKNGPEIITASELRGLIAFPSYHAVLAFTAMYAARNVKYVAPVFLILNLLILPSIFIHGGHHLLDLPAGFLMFLFGTWLAKNAMEKYKQAPHASVVLAS